MTEELFNQITEWQKATFGQATALSKVNHLVEEVQELKEDLENSNPMVHHEFADCFLLLFGAASSHGYSYNDINTIIREKFEIVKTRKWGEPDANGVVKHIKQTTN